MDFGCVVDFFGGNVSWGFRLDLGLGVEASLPLGTERRPRNRIRGVCLERIWVARIFAVVCVICGLW